MFIEKLFGKSFNITKSDLKKALTNSNENVYLEFKSDIPNTFDNLIKPIVAMANNRGGLLLLGIKDDKNIIGLSKEKYSKEGLSGSIRNLIKPEKFTSSTNIYEIKIGDTKSVFVIDVPPFERICAGYNSKSKNYVYFTMNNSEKVELTPEELQILAYTKSDYQYNKEYRTQISHTIKHYLNDIFDLLNNRNGNIFIHFEENKFGSEEDYKKLHKLVEVCDLKTLSINLYEDVFDLIEDILNLTIKIPHKSNLTLEEDKNYNELLSYFLSLFGIDREDLKPEKIRKIMLERRGKQNTLSLEGYIRDYLDGSLVIYPNRLKKEEIDDFYQELKTLLWSYNKNLNDLNKFLIDYCDHLNVSNSIKTDLIRYLNEFPDEFCDQLSRILIRVIDLYESTKKALKTIS